MYEFTYEEIKKACQLISINKAQSHDMLIDKEITLKDDIGKKLDKETREIYF